MMTRHTGEIRVKSGNAVLELPFDSPDIVVREGDKVEVTYNKLPFILLVMAKLFPEVVKRDPDIKLRFPDD